MRTIERITNSERWDAAVRALPYPHVLQSWTWGAFKGERGWRPLRLLWRKGEDVLAVAQILIRQQGQLRVGYIPKGPLLDWGDLPLFDEVLTKLEAVAREERLILLKLDPDVRSDTPCGQAVRRLLRQRGWQPSFEQIQFRNTMILDIRPELDALMARMKPKWRYNIRLAVRRGVHVREAAESELPLLYRMYAETAARDNFIIREEAYYLDVWRRFIRVGMATPLLAEVQGEPVAMLILFHFGPVAWYMYGASRSRHRRAMPNHLLQWEAIRRAKVMGCTTYDLWGAPDELNEQASMWGVYRFKAGFGAEFVPHIGAYDYPPRRWLYHAYAFFRPRLVKLAQHHYWRRRATHF